MKIFRNPRDDWLASFHPDLHVDHITKKMVSDSLTIFSYSLFLEPPHRGQKR